MSTFPRGNLPAISFTETSTTAIESEIITTYETIAGRSLASGDPVRLFLESIAAIIVNQRSIIDFSAKQNLLSYAEGDFLDYLAELVGVTRLAAQPAQTTIQFTLSAVQASAYTIPTGTVVTNGILNFATTEPLEIAIGYLTGTAGAECQTAGVVGNNLLPGQIRTLLQPLPYIQSVANTTTTQGGAEIETDDSLVERIRLAPASFSVAGPIDSYVYWSLTANQAIIDVAVSSPTPGLVDIRPLLDGGIIPGQDILDQVSDVLSAENVRPLTDEVQVQAPVAENYTVDVEYWLFSRNAAQSGTLQSAVNTAVNDYALWQKSAIGRDINPDELVARMKNAGAKRVNIISPTFTVLDDTQVAQDTAINIVYMGLEDG